MIYLGDIDAIIAWNVLVSNPACNGESQAFGTFEKLNIKEFFIGINELWLLAFDIQFHSVSRSFQTFDSNTMADIDYINVIHSAKKKSRFFFHSGICDKLDYRTHPNFIVSELH